MNLHNRKFITTENKHGISSGETIFHYYQVGNVITGKYKGGAITEGFIVGKQIEESILNCYSNA